MIDRDHLPALLIRLFLLLAATGRCDAEGIALDRQRVAAVQAGTIDTARASWWGFDPVDATRSLQAALDSRARKVVVDNLGKPWVVTTIQLPSHKEIVFEKGVVVEAKRGEFRAKNACLFVAMGRKQLVLRGNGATLRMHKTDYHRPPYEPAEWRHCLSIRGCQDVTVEGLTLADSGGDGIYLGAGQGGTTNRKITIRGVICEGNNRQGISVITAEDLLIEDCVFRNTEGTAPQAGIDFEPNRAEERLVRCVLRRCCSENNAGHAYLVFLGSLDRESTPVSIRFEQCTSRGCRRCSTYVGLANRDGKPCVGGLIEFVGCQFEADEGGGVYIRGSQADGCRVRCEQCRIIRRDAKPGRLAPITIEPPSRLDVDAGNVQIDRCIIEDAVARQPLGLIASPLVRLRNLSGSLEYRSPAGAEHFVLDAEQLRAWFPQRQQLADIASFPFDWRRCRPVPGPQSAATAGLSFRLRRTASLLAWGQAGKPWQLTVRFDPVGHFQARQGKLVVTAADGTSRPVRPVKDGDRFVFRMASPATGPLHVQWTSDSHTTLRPLQCSSPLALLVPPTGVHLFRPQGRLYFAVPAGVHRFALLVAGAGTAETVRATVCDSTGRVVAQQDNIAEPHVFVLQRDGKAARLIWSIQLERAGRGVLEDVTLQALGIPPLVAGAPKQLFTTGGTGPLREDSQR